MKKSETWALRKAQQDLLERTDLNEKVEMDDGNKEDWEIRKEVIRAREGVANTSEKIRETRLGWFMVYERPCLLRLLTSKHCS